MNQVNAAPAVIPAITHTLSHWGRVLVFFCTAGFAYPNVWTEGMDFTRADLGKQKK